MIQGQTGEYSTMDKVHMSGFAKRDQITFCQNLISSTNGQSYICWIMHESLEAIGTTLMQKQLRNVLLSRMHNKIFPSL